MNEAQVYLQSLFTFSSLVEISILTFLFYIVFTWIQGTQAEQVVRGLIILMILLPLSDWFGFTTINFLIRSIFAWLLFLILIVFQPELRSALEQIGSGFSSGVLKKNTKAASVEETVNTLLQAIKDLCKEKTGALIVCLGNTGLRDIEVTGTLIDAKLTPALLLNIFYDKSPLHDGAVIVSIPTDTIEAAGCILPLTNRTDLPIYFGTRHRAGIGISEQSDALTIIVSEETGKVTITQNGTFIHHISMEELKKKLYQIYVDPLDDQSNKGMFSNLVQRIRKNDEDEK